MKRIKANNQIKRAVINGKTAYDITKVMPEIFYIQYNYKDKKEPSFLQVLAVDKKSYYADGEDVRISGREIIHMNNRYYLTADFCVLMINEPRLKDYKNIVLKHGATEIPFNGELDGLRENVQSYLELAKTLGKIDDL